MTNSPSLRSLSQSVGDGIRSFLVGNPTLPDRLRVAPLSSHRKLFFMFICGAQLTLFIACALGGLLFWVYVQWNNGVNPLKGTDSNPFLSLMFEGWPVIGFILGIVIVRMSGVYAIPPGVEWGKMGIRLAGVVITVLLVSHAVGEWRRDTSFMEESKSLVQHGEATWMLKEETISLLTSLVLLLPSYVFLKHGWITLDELIHLTPEKIASPSKFFVKREHLIFISYRREDSQPETERIAENLMEQFGEKVVIQDKSVILPGVKYPERLMALLNNCSVLLAVIGPNWLSAKDEQGNLRLNSESDWVRIEIATALRRNIPIFPLFVANAKPPTEEELPASISKLAFQQGIPIRGNPEFKDSMDRLTNILLTTTLKEYVKK